jgi:hypothetical protein
MSAIPPHSQKGRQPNGLIINLEKIKKIEEL